MLLFPVLPSRNLSFKRFGFISYQAFSFLVCYITLVTLTLFDQVKLLKDVKKGKVVIKKHSRGVGFVDFKEHQHALVALRVLNNNPGKI